jgi:hypothetical protein
MIKINQSSCYQNFLYNNDRRNIIENFYPLYDALIYSKVDFVHYTVLNLINLEKIKYVGFVDFGCINSITKEDYSNKEFEYE